MFTIWRFLRATILGGLVILVPVAVLGALAYWVFGSALKAIVPVFEWLPDQSVAGVSLTVLVAVASLVILCFALGLLADLAFIRRLGDGAERLALFFPGYALMKNVGANLVGIEQQHPVKTVLVRFPASWQLGFLMDTLPDGRQVVFIPGVPRALVGTLHIVEAERVEPLAMTVSVALDALSRLGVGLQKEWPKTTAAA